MPKVQKPKPTPKIDMTPMVDLAFLLVTFFMLSANFRTDEVVTIDIPYSISEELMPESYMQINVDKKGKVYIGFSGNTDLKKEILAELADKAKLPLDQLTEKQVTNFTSIAEFGTSLRTLPQYLDLNTDEVKALAESNDMNAIPVDSSRNELKVWVRAIYDVQIKESKRKLEDAIKKDKNVDAKQLAQDLKPKFIIKADKDAPYHFVNSVVDTFKDMDMDTKFSFVTSMVADPRK